MAGPETERIDTVLTKRGNLILIEKIEREMWCLYMFYMCPRYHTFLCMCVCSLEFPLL